MILTEWLKQNTEYEEAVFIDANGKERTIWIDNDSKYNAEVLRVENKNKFCANVYTNYLD